MPSPNDNLIEKRTLYAGTKSIDFKEGTKVHFHFQTKLCNHEQTTIDDSKKMGPGKPMQLVLGKKFKLEVWEVIVQKLALNEIASFIVNKNLVLEYPFVSKTLRDMHAPKEQRKSHCCGMMLQSEGLGYDDLNDLFKNPADLEFIIELVDVELPESYDKEVWQMSDTEKFDLIPVLKQSGNQEFKNKNYDVAVDHYSKAIGMLEQLMIKEKPQDLEWKNLEQMKLPLLLNFSQCMLIKGDYYTAIQHCSTVIKSEPDNVKAYYRRAKAHVGAWNPKEALDDFNKAMELDPSLIPTIKKEISHLEELIKIKDDEDKDKLKKLFC